MACESNEIVINKACSIKLTDNIYAILTAQYHTEPKGSGQKSFYQLAGRVATKEQLVEEIAEMNKDENKLNDWTWGDSRMEGYYITYDHKHSNAQGATWLTNRIIKAYDKWEDFYNLISKGIKIVGGKNPRTKISNSAKYELDGWETLNGEKFDIENPESLLKHVGEYIIRRQPLKRDLTAQLVAEIKK